MQRLRISSKTNRVTFINESNLPQNIKRSSMPETTKHGAGMSIQSMAKARLSQQSFQKFSNQRSNTR